MNIKIEKDKLLHFFISFAASFFTSLAIWLISSSDILAVISGCLFSLGLGLGKEYGDSKAYGNKWCWVDLLFDVLGILSFVILYVLVVYI